MRATRQPRARPAPDLPRPPTPTSRPTAERVGHGDELVLPDVNGHAFKPWWAIRSRLDGLYADRMIGRGGYLAACQLRADYERAGGRMPSGLAGAGMGGRAAPGAGHDRLLGQTDAAGRLREARAKLGPGRYALAVAVIVEDAPWAALGRQLGVSARLARQAAALAIARLGR